jgi:hypothetical protein
MEQDAHARTWIELVELFNKNWSLRLAPTARAHALLEVPVTISFKRQDTGEVHSVEVNGYQFQQELPRVVYLFHSLIFGESKPE